MSTPQMGGRLSVVSTDPMPTGNNTSNTVTLVPYLSDECTVWSGAAWTTYQIPAGGVGVSVNPVTDVSKLFDIFAYVNAGTLILESNWWGGSVRATPLAYHQGILVKGGDITKRYLGTGFTRGDGAGFNDGENGRWLYNNFNKAPRPFKMMANQATWLCGNPNWQCPANNPGFGTIGIVAGQPDVTIRARLFCTATPPTNPAGSYRVQAAFGLDSQTARFTESAFGQHADAGASPANRSLAGLWAEINTHLTTGYHYLQWLERCVNGVVGVDQATMYGTGFVSGFQGVAHL